MLTLEHISKSFQGKTVLSDVSLSVGVNEVIAIVGANGSGKTTLLRIMHGELEPDSGTIHRHKEYIGYVPQHLILGKTIRDSFAGNLEDWRIDQALGVVGLEEKPNSILVTQLSGGQKTRLAIATILAQDFGPTILLLDEPTNNLDRRGKEWLEEYIKAFRGGVAIVSHDRSFINRVATSIAELDNNGPLKQYTGNYDHYVTQKAIEKQSQADAYKTSIQERERLLRLQKQKTVMLEHASTGKFDKRKHESRMHFQGKKNNAEKTLGKQVKNLDSRIEQLDIPTRPTIEKQRSVVFFGETSSAKLILRLERISKAYDRPVLTAITIELRGNERVHIDGANGSGKTTLLKIAAGMIEPDSGKVTVGAHVSIGYLSQDVDDIDQRKTALENLRLTGASDTAIYRQAQALGLSAKDLLVLPARLSLGQQTKLGFAKLLLSSHQLLILDEPTNHIDITTREAIERALQAYKGAMIVASHDGYFVKSLGATTFVI